MDSSLAVGLFFAIVFWICIYTYLCIQKRNEEKERAKEYLNSMAQMLEAKMELIIALDAKIKQEADLVKKAKLKERRARVYFEANNLADRANAILGR